MPDCCLEHVYQTRLLLLDPPGGDVRLTAIGRWRMDQVVERPAALDVHKEQVTACVRVPGEGGERRGGGGGVKTTVRGLLGVRDLVSGVGGPPVGVGGSGGRRCGSSRRLCGACSGCAIGCRSRVSRMWRWRPPACTGGRCGRFWRTGSSCCCATRRT